jgi:ABC-2 type transport system permease protein
VSGMAYTRFELLRTFRNKRFLIFSLGFPLVLFLFIALPGRHEHDFGGTGIALPLYYMVGLASFGTMMAMVSSGARIANERQSGWTRQLRITPLTTPAYFRAKVMTAYAMATLTIVVLYTAGIAVGVRMPAGQWLEMTGLLFVGLLPFAALGVLLGHLLTVDSLGPATGGIVSLLALLSGTWFPVSDSGFLHDVAQGLPSYWLTQASHVSLGGSGWSSTGWLVIAAWTVVLARLARMAYRRDTQRV